MRGFAAAWVLLLAGASIGAGPSETWLRYRLIPGHDGGLDIGYRRVVFERLASQRPDDFKARPETSSKRPFYGRILSGRWVILDQSRPESTTYDVLWLDRNNDGLFERGDRLSLSAHDANRRSAMVSIAFESPDGPVLQHFTIVASTRPDLAYLKVMNAGYCFGGVRFGEKVHRVALLDQNANGTFNDVAGAGNTGDCLLVDRNGDGRFDTRQTASEEVLWVGRYVRVDGAYWGVRIQPDGSGIMVEPGKPVMGKLQVDDGAVEIVVSGKAGRFRFRRKSADESFSMPVGSYKIESVTVDRKAEDGRRWRLRSRGGDGKSFVVAANDTVKMPTGDPVVARALVQRANGMLSCRYELQGEDGLSYQILVDGTRMPDPPRLVLREKGGSWQKEHAFQYG